MSSFWACINCVDSNNKKFVAQPRKRICGCYQGLQEDIWPLFQCSSIWNEKSLDALQMSAAQAFNVFLSWFSIRIADPKSTFPLNEIDAARYCRSRFWNTHITFAVALRFQWSTFWGSKTTEWWHPEEIFVDKHLQQKATWSCSWFTRSLLRLTVTKQQRKHCNAEKIGHLQSQGISMRNEVRQRLSRICWPGSGSSRKHNNLALRHQLWFCHWNKRDGLIVS